MLFNPNSPLTFYLSSELPPRSSAHSAVHFSGTLHFLHTRTRVFAVAMGDTKPALMRLKIADLRARCAESGLDEDGTKADLVERLLSGTAEHARAKESAEKSVVANEETLTEAAKEACESEPSSPTDVDVVVGDHDELLEHLRENPSDGAGWERCARIARAMTIPSARPLFDAITEQFPRSSLAWCWYVDAEIERSESGTPDDEAIRGIFGKCLIPCPSALLWRRYASYMASTQDVTTEEGVNTMKSVYEYSIDIVGEDADAADLWLDYCQFLRNTEATLIVTDVQVEQAPSARDMIVRRTYQKAILVPMHKLDMVYKSYEAFEQEKNKTLAKALLLELAPKLLLTRTALGKRKKVIDGVVVGAVCVDPVQRGADGSASVVCPRFNASGCAGCDCVHECKYCGSSLHGAKDCATKQYTLLAPDLKQCAAKWAEVIEFEKTNAQRLEGSTPSDVSPQLFARIKHAYELAGLSLGETPEFWLEYAHWHEVEGRTDDAADVLQRGREALPYCTLLVFAAADLEETRGDVDACKKVYETVLDAYESYATEAAERGEEVTMPADTILAYCEYIRACRRAEDQASSRKAFMRARKAHGATWEIYATAATIEWSYDKADKPARNIFELGLKNFLSVPAYVERYAEFLIGINDIANVSALFGRALNESPSTKIWDMFVDFERSHGTMDTILDAESRRNAACGAMDLKTNLLNALLGRHMCMDIRAASAEYCDYFASLGAVVPMNKAEASRVSFASLRAERLAREAMIAAVPAPSAPKGTPKRKPPPPPPVEKTKLTGQLGKFFSSLPGPVAFSKFPPPRVDAVLDAIKRTDLSEEAIAGYLSKMGYQGGEKRKAIELIDDPALTASRAAASARPPAKDVFRSRQGKMARAQAEYQ